MVCDFTTDLGGLMSEASAASLIDTAYLTAIANTFDRCRFWHAILEIRPFMRMNISLSVTIPRRHSPRREDEWRVVKMPTRSLFIFATFAFLSHNGI